MKSEEIKLMKENIEVLQEKVRKPMTHERKLVIIKELIDDWVKNLKEPINANDIYQWCKFAFVAGA